MKSLVLLSAVFFATVVCLAAPGDLDPTFGTGGKVITADIGTIYDIALQPDGKIVAVGGDGASIVRYNANGSLDNSFGGSGIVTVHLGAGYDVFLGKVAIQADGKIVVAAETYCGFCGGVWSSLVIRYNPNGTPDLTFNGTGMIDTLASRSVAIHTDGKIVVAGGDFVVVVQRFNSNGTPDSSFNGTGTVITQNNDSAFAMAIQPDGKIAVVGNTDGFFGGNFVIIRYNADGSPDTSFGGTGIVNTHFDGYDRGVASSLAIQSDGRIVVKGVVGNEGHAVASIVRYNQNGSTDTSFGINGVIYEPHYVTNIFDDVAIKPDGKIVTVGTTFNGANNDFSVARYNPNGSPDPTFNDVGLVTTDFGSSESPRAVAIQADGKIIAAGHTADDDFALARYEDVDPTAVTNTNDSGAGSLRQAIADAAPGDTINFSVTGTITLTSGELVIDKDLTIHGPGASLLSISGNQTSKVFSVNSGVTVTLDGMTIRDGGGNFNDFGGGIYNAGSLTVSNSIISGNTAGLFCGSGGGIFNHNGTLAISNSTIAGNRSLNWEQCGEGGGITNHNGTVTITSSTISGNQESGEGGGGGGLLNYSAGTMSIVNSTISGNMGNFGGGISNHGTLTIANCTITGNIGRYDGGGISSWSNSETLTNTIVSGNISPDGNDIFGSIDTASHNLIGDAGSSGGIVNGVNGNIVGLNPMLGPLQNNGGPTFTHALRPGSPAINAGDNCVLTVNGCGDGNPALPTDQRGMPRNGTVDIGAFERQAIDVSSATLFDYDGDGKSDVSVWRPSNGDWYIAESKSKQMRVRQWGLADDVIVPADYDGDGTTDLAVWRPSQGRWYIFRAGNIIETFNWGLPGDIPLPGDRTGDGKAELVVYRPSNQNWYILDPRTGVMEPPTRWGLPDDKPIPADYDGDGKVDLAVFRPSQGRWYIRHTTNVNTSHQWGLAGDIPVPGDYTGDGKADHAVYRPSNQNWYRFDPRNGSTDIVRWGLPDDLPVPADYDGDGKMDFAVFRPSQNRWYINGTTAGFTQTFGLAGDLPTPNAFVF